MEPDVLKRELDKMSRVDLVKEIQGLLDYVYARVDVIFENPMYGWEYDEIMNYIEVVDGDVEYIISFYTVEQTLENYKKGVGVQKNECIEEYVMRYIKEHKTDCT